MLKIISSNRIPILFIALFIPLTAQAADMISVVDATDLSRGLLAASSEYPVKTGTFELYSPEWIPGIHGPRNPIQNLAEVSVFDGDGNAIEWRRDPHYVYRFQAEVPKNVRRIVVKTTYICNQPSVNSRGVDSYGNPLLGVINWNTILLYPAGPKASDTEVDLTLKLPDEWKWGSSLIEKERQANAIRFESISYEQLIDSPLICGKYLRTFDLTPKDGPEHCIHLVSESEAAVKPDEKTIDGLKRIVREGVALFDSAHFEKYHFLLVLSDTVPGFGLEHLKSSLNGRGERGLLDENQIPGTCNLLSHEYSHSWCGKYRRPAGMVTPDFNTPKDTRMLWVYEGLDQYLGEVLAARAVVNGKDEKENFEATLKDLGGTIRRYMNQKGRRSIPLEDTSSSAYIRRGGSRYWNRLNRGQDYYSEGAMLWLEIDAILRSESEGKFSLDDFCRKFLSVHDKSKICIGYEESNIIETLNDLLKYDWTTLIDDRVRGLHDSLPLDFIGKCGYRVQYSNKPTDFDKDSIFTSLGISTSSNETITRIVPGSPADEAGLYEGAKIIGVNDRKFSKNRLEDAIADSVANPQINLLCIEGDVFETIVIEYDRGPKYLDLVRNDKDDLLKEIWKPIGEQK